MLPGTVQAAPAGVKGFDVNIIVDGKQAVAFWEAGFRFALRYVGRVEMDPKKDLTTAEAEMLLSKGFALMPVQHVEKDHGWMPTADKGVLYGTNAAKFAQQIGFPQGVNVWMDLEGVSRSASPEDVDAYCRSWYAAVAAARYEPGVYVGDQPGLTARELYALPFRHYWRAYNLNDDLVPHPRGYQLIQSSSSVPVGKVGGDYDVDTTYVDAMGGQVLWLKV